MRIEDYALIGDTQTAALVGRDGSIDWLCLPRFDSGACFAALLGDRSNGRWLIAPSEGSMKRVERRYRDSTLVLETEFTTDSGTVRLVDCMPPRGDAPDLVRVVEGVTGRVAMQMELIIRFDYGAIIPWVRRADGRLVAIAGPDSLWLQTPVEVHGEDLTTVAEFTVSEGDRVPFVLTWHPPHLGPPRPIEPFRAVDDTVAWGQEWCGRSTYDGEWRDLVTRSLLTLKALTYGPTGGIVAAATTSLPEQLGGVRNWDYRYCWLRDSTFTLYALMSGGYAEEARKWRDWLLRAVAGQPAAMQIMYGPAGERRLSEMELDWLAGYEDEARAWRDWLLRAIAGLPDQLQIMYGLAGERRLPELELEWLDGYEGSKPVRIGNAAVNQFQLGVYGEVMDSLHQSRRHGIGANEEAWSVQKVLMDFLESRWDEPDEGIWEVRGPRRHFTHSKVMAWVAADRAARAVEDFKLDGDAARWRSLCQEIRQQVCRDGFDAARNTFVQSYGSQELDASLLMIPLVGFLPPTDARVAGTVDAIRGELTDEHGFVMRYSHQGDTSSLDGLPPGEGAFLACSFWMVDNLALLGRTDEARTLFERLIGLANDVGLLAEEYDADAGRLVGNFPQAFSHVGLVNSATNLSSTSAWQPSSLRGTK